MRRMWTGLLLAAVAGFTASACERGGPTESDQATEATEVLASGSAERHPSNIEAQGQQFALAGAAPSGKRILLYHSDHAANAAFLQDRLLATGHFAEGDVDVLAMTSSPVELVVLANYDCVLAWTNRPPPSPTAQGDRLRDHVDEGGSVILATYAISPLSRNWRLRGGIMSDGYAPLGLTHNQLTNWPDGLRSLDYATAIADHPILAGVTEFTFGGNGNFIHAHVRDGTVLVARDTEGAPLIALNEMENVAAINVQPGGIFVLSPGVFGTLANACVHMSGGADVPSTLEAHLLLVPEDRTINARAQGGRLRVAVLGSAALDVTTVEIGTVRLGAEDTDGVPVAVRPNGRPFVAVEDVDEDGIPDLVVDFDLPTMVAEGHLYAPGATVVLRAELDDGTALRGELEVRVKDPGRP